MKQLILLVFLINSYTSFSQNSCFDKYEIEDIYVKQNRDSAFKARFQRFVDFVKDCKFPDFKVTTINGDTIELNKLKGKVVVINFWFNGCAPCIAELPALNKLAEDFKSKDVVFIAFSRDKKSDIIKNFLTKYTFNFQIVPNNFSVKDNIQDKFKIFFGWPMTYILDKKGKVKFVTHGAKVDETSKFEIYYKLKSIIENFL